MMEGDVVMKRGKNGMDYATGVGVGMGGDRVAFMFFGEAMDKAGNCLRGGCSYTIRGGLVKIKYQSSVGGPFVPVDVFLQKYLQVEDIALSRCSICSAFPFALRAIWLTS